MRLSFVDFLGIAESGPCLRPACIESGLRQDFCHFFLRDAVFLGFHDVELERAVENAARNEGRDSHDAPDLGRKLVCSRPYFAEEDVVIEMSKFRCKAPSWSCPAVTFTAGAGAGSAALALTIDNPVKRNSQDGLQAANFLSAECFIVFLPFCYGFLLRRPARNLFWKKMQSSLHSLHRNQITT